MRKNAARLALAAAAALCLVALLVGRNPASDTPAAPSSADTPPPVTLSLPAYPGTSRSDPAVGTTITSVPVDGATLIPAGTGAIVVIVTDDDGSWWATAQLDGRPARHVVTIAAGRADLSDQYGFTDQIFTGSPGWLIIQADSTIALRHVGPVTAEEYSRWETLLRAAAP